MSHESTTHPERLKARRAGLSLRRVLGLWAAFFAALGDWEWVQ